VRDNGIGIPPDMLPRVFDMFVQERQALDRAQGGLGLGLAIVRSLLQMHGGSAVAHSDGAGHGAELTVRLPLSSDAQAGVAPEQASPTPVMAKSHKRILIVDDNEDIAIMISDLLRVWGYETRFAHDAVSALALAESFDPDIAAYPLWMATSSPGASARTPC